MLVVEGHLIPVHSLILWSQSEVFEKMMSSNMIETKEKIIYIEGANFRIFSKIVEYLQAGFENPC